MHSDTILPAERFDVSPILSEEYSKVVGGDRQLQLLLQGFAFNGWRVVEVILKHLVVAYTSREWKKGCIVAVTHGRNFEDKLESPIFCYLRCTGGKIPMGLVSFPDPL